MLGKHFFTTPLLLCCLCTLCGCTDSLRFAPTEPQKQTAELTHQAAIAINQTGTAPQTEATRQLVRGTQAALAYIGRPKVPPDPVEFSAYTTQAQADSVKRPAIDDVFAAAEHGLSLAAQLAILFGVGGAGFGGKKVLDWIVLASQKSKALEEIIKGGEVFKAKASAIGDSKAVDLFKMAQAGQSPQTKVLVTELKS